MLPYVLFMTALLYGVQGSPLDGTWELVRIFHSGRAAATHTVPIDSTVYLRLTLKVMPGDWIDGRLYRRYHGAEERTKIEAGPLRGTGRYIIGADLDLPVSQKARTAAWLAGDGVLRLGTPFVPDADSLELRRVSPDAPYPASVIEVVTAP